MGRINIEDSIYRDERFHRLSAHEGKYKALGLCVVAWDLAHRYYLKHPDGLIPFAEWDSSAELRLLEKYGLAERRETGIYVKGTKNQCEYLTKRSEAGRKGGLKSQENFSSKRKQIEQNQPSSSFSSSDSSSCSTKTLPERSPKAPSGGSMVWDAYREAYLAKYKTEPVRNAKVNAQCLQLHKRLGESAIEVVRFYLTLTKPFYVQASHELGRCVSDAEALHTQYKTGVPVVGPSNANGRNLRPSTDRTNDLDAEIFGVKS